MSKVLDGVNRLSLIESIDGDDTRFEKIVEATELLVTKLQNDELLLIPSVLASLNKNIHSDDIAIKKAEECLLEIWKSANTVYVDPPVLVYRSMLLEACNKISEDRVAYILWNTIASVLPFIDFGREVEIFKDIYLGWAEESERYSSLGLLESSGENKAPFPKRLPKLEVNIDLEKVNDFQTMFDEISKVFVKREDLYQEQYRRFKEYRETTESNIRINENMKLDTLWWSMSFSSPYLNKSYREFDPKIALILMVSDLLRLTKSAPPATVSYLLSETVSQLPKVDFETKISLKELWEYYSSNIDNFPKQVIENLHDTCEGSWSLSDFIVMALKGSSLSVDEAISKLAVSRDIKISLPALAQAIFREDSAINEVSS